jgi:two-component system phosphate regulon response regulator PhoB
VTNAPPTASSASASSDGKRSRGRIMVVEDEPAIVMLLQYNLTKEGYEVVVCEDGDSALTQALERAPDLILLDWMLPGRSGINVCKTLRAHPTLKRVPILMVTARSDTEDVVKGLKAGADAYVRKPFAMRELLHLIRQHLRILDPRRSRGTLVLDDLVVKPDSGEARRGERELTLQPAERKLLQTLVERPGRIFQRQELFAKLFADASEPPAELDASAQRKLDAVVRTLRKELTKGGESDLIRSIRGIGYAAESQN